MSDSPVFLISHRGALGDFLLTWPTLVSLRSRFHGHRFIGLGKPDYMEMARDFGLVDEIQDCESARFLPLYAGTAFPEEFAKVEHALFWVADSMALAMLLREKISGFLRIHPPFPVDASHVMDHHLEALPFFQLPLPAVGQDLFFPLSPRREGMALVHPGSGSPSKNYDPQFYAFLANELKSRRFPDTRILLGPAERHLKPVYADKFTLVEPATCSDLARLVSSCALFIGNDSGVSHLAGLTGAKTLVLYKQPNMEQWGVRGRQVHHVEGTNEALAMSRIQRVLSDQD